MGIAGLFPDYFGGASLAQQAANVVPHAIYLAVWAASAVLIALGGTRQQAGALLAAGTSIVTLGLFVADAGTAISGGVPVAAGLVLSLIGWAACAAGSVLAVRRSGAGSPARPANVETVLTMGLAAAAALGTAIAFAPSWDRFTLRTAAGTSQTLTAGNAFANPGLVIAGDVAAMVALVAVVIAAGAWRPMRHGAVLLAGGIVPMAAQAISAVIQISQAASPAQFGIPPAQAAGVGLTISSGLTLAFWIYCGFVGALILTCALMFSTPAAPPPPPVQVPAHQDPLDAASPGAPNPATTPIIAPTAPPNRNTSPALLAVTITLPPLVPLASTKVAMNQPTAGVNPPSACWVPHAPSRQVARMATSRPTAASGAGPTP